MSNSENTIYSQKMQECDNLSSVRNSSETYCIITRQDRKSQIITEKDDSLMYSLINKWYQITGEPSLVNTSFNRHEEPIVCSPIDALNALVDGIVDVVCFNDEIICKVKS